MTSVILSEIGRKIALLRKRYFPQDNQATFALRVGVSKTTYVKIEQGNSQVAIGSYFKVAAILNVEDQFSAVFTAPKESINLFELSGIDKSKRDNPKRPKS